jgi:chorismate dehydratase
VIGANGAVASVALFSEVPIDEIKSIYLDYQSRTSVQLLKILLTQYWKVEVNFLVASEEYIAQISGTTAGVIIGDRALENLSKYPYVYDLSLAWKQHTGLPFVFAAWVANQPIPAAFMTAFDAANEHGLSHLDEVIAGVPDSEQKYNLQKYYTENISYAYTADKKEGLDLFLKLLKS